jgi:hypothetical protein
VPTEAAGCGSGSCSCKSSGSLQEPGVSPESLDAQFERGELHLASMATRI